MLDAAAQADANAPYTTLFRSLLHLAAENGHVEVVRLLVAELGADANTKANGQWEGRTPLHEVGWKEHVEAMQAAKHRTDADAKPHRNAGRRCTGGRKRQDHIG